MKTFSINTLKQVLLSADDSMFTEYTIDDLINDFRFDIAESNFSQPTDDDLLDDELLSILATSIQNNYEFPEIIFNDLVFNGLENLNDYLEEI